MNKKRIAVEKVDIDYNDTKRFFNKRSEGDYATPLSATMYQDKQPELVIERDQAEKQIVGNKLISQNIQSVFDVGCGIGRWGWFWAEQAPEIHYLGIDFSESLVDMARGEAIEKGFNNLQFQTMSAVDIESEKLLLAPPFSCIIVSGLLIYLNDSDCLRLLETLTRLLAPGGLLYIREPVALEERLTLDKYYSEELNSDYSAIYRSLDEMKLLFDQAFSGNLVLDEDAALFPDKLEKRAQTRQHYMIFKRQS